MGKRANGGVLGVVNTPTTNKASGLWSLAEVALYKKAGTWPSIATFALSVDSASVNKGGSFTVTLTTTGVADGTLVPYEITGIASGDLSSGSLTGNFTVTSNTGSLTFTTASSGGTSGDLTATFSCGGDTETITFVEGDTYFKYVTALLHGDGTNAANNNTFTDSSSNNFTITRNGDTTQGTFTPYGDTWSNYFDGSSNYLTVGNPSTSSALDFGSSDFTVESWVYPTVTTPIVVIGSLDNNSGNGCWWLVINATFGGGGLIQFGYNTTSGGTGTNILFGSGTFSTNTWSHVAVTRSGSSIRAFVNGTQVGSTNTGIGSSAIYAVNQNIQIGRSIVNVGAAYQMTGYISNTRLVKGGALYTSTFTPSTTALTTTVSSGTVSLLTCQSNRFKDNSSNAFAITVNGSPSVQKFSPFSPTAAYSTSGLGGSAYFDGTGDYLSVASNAGLAPGTGDFGVQFFVNFQSASETFVPFFETCTVGSANNTHVFFAINSGALKLQQHGPSPIVASCAFSPSLNSWYHLAVSRVSGTVYIFINGVSQSVTNATGFNGFNIAQSGFSVAAITTPYYLQGAISSFVYQVGTGFTSITVPTIPPSAPTNCQLLLNFTNGGIIDNAMMNDLVTVGNAQISTSVKKYGTGSMYFDGTGDALSLPNNSWMKFGTGDFTIEAWIYPTVTGDRRFVSLYDDPNNQFLFRLNNSTNTVAFNIITGASSIVNLTSSSSVSLNTWTHVAAVRNGSSFIVYINGVNVASGSSSSAFPAYTSKMWVSTYDGTNEPFYGYIDDLRITKGYARYTSNFTAPTGPFQDR